MAKTFSRKELYDLVWSTPMKTLAATVGVSDVALAKACRSADIPVPERGYWAKLRAGKAISRRALPPRFPGASDEITVGASRWYGSYAQHTLDDPLPPPPVFEEEMDVLTERVRKMVGKVTCPPLTSPHRLIAKLLEQDEDRRSKGYSWDRPKFEAPEEKRRLRILNALFTAAHKAGCSASMSTSKYAQDTKDASIQVGSQNIPFTLAPISGKAGRKEASPGKPRLQLSIHSRQHGVANMGAWEDGDTSKLEDQLTQVLIGIIVAAETFHRENAVHHHEWLIKRRAEMVEELRRKKEEEIRKARELKEKLERERIERLLAQADAMHKATVIRTYVDAVLARSSDVLGKPEALQRWATWARAQADRIDPVLNGAVDLTTDEGDGAS